MSTLISATNQAVNSTPILPHQIVLWHLTINGRCHPIPGVIVSTCDETQSATIKVRNLQGQIQYIEHVNYAELEVR